MPTLKDPFTTESSFKPIHISNKAHYKNTAAATGPDPETSSKGFFWNGTTSCSMVSLDYAGSVQAVLCNLKSPKPKTLSRDVTQKRQDNPAAISNYVTRTI